MESHLHADDPAAQARMRSFFQFMDLEEAAGNVDFHIKPGARTGSEAMTNVEEVRPYISEQLRYKKPSCADEWGRMCYCRCNSQHRGAAKPHACAGQHGSTQNGFPVGVT